MAIIKVTRKDVLASSTVKLDWYPLIVRDVEVAEAKDKSTNFVVTLKFIQEEYKDYFIKKMYLNEKGIFGTGLNLLKACGLPAELLEKIRNKEMEDVNFDTSNMIDKQILGKVGPTTWEGRTSNEALDFMPLEQR